MRESTLWATVKKELSLFGRLKRIEDRAGLGTPDVYYRLRRRPVAASVGGWIELKHVANPPKRPGTPICIDHLTIDQVNWLADEGDAGGNAWLLLQVARWYCMMTPPQARRLYDKGYVLEDLLVDCCHPGEGGIFPTKRILSALTNSD